MDKTAQRIAFARALGWRIYESNGSMYYERPGGDVFNHTIHFDELPDIDDLNVIHEAEKILIKEYWQYRLVFQSVKGLGGNNHEKHFMATAGQRTEAILRYLNLWMD